MKPILVMHNGAKHQIVEVAKSLFHSGMITNVYNTGGRLAVNLVTNELTIVRGQAVVDYQLLKRANKKQPVEKAVKLVVGRDHHWNRTMAQFLATKDTAKDEIDSLIKAGFKVELCVGDSSYKSTSRTFWANFAKIGNK